MNLDQMYNDGKREGRAKGRAKDVLAVLEVRGVPVSAAQRKWVLACTDDAKLDAADIQKLAKMSGATDRAPLLSSVDNFYFTNPVARCSAIMAECSALATGRQAMSAAE